MYPGTSSKESSDSKLRKAQELVDSLKAELLRLTGVAAAHERRADEGLEREVALLKGQEDTASDRTQSDDAHRSIHLQDQRELDVLRERLQEQKAENVRLANHRAHQRKAQLDLQNESARRAEELAGQAQILAAQRRENEKLRTQVESGQSALDVAEERLQQFSTDLQAEKGTHRANITSFQAASRATNQRHAAAQRELKEERDRLEAEKVTLQEAQRAAEENAALMDAERASFLSSQQRAEVEKSALAASEQQAKLNHARSEAEKVNLLSSRQRAEEERVKVQTENTVLLAARTQAEEQRAALEAEKAVLLASRKRAEAERAQAEAEKAALSSARERAEEERLLVERDNAALLAFKKQAEKDRLRAESEKASLIRSREQAEGAALQKSYREQELLDTVAALTARFDTFETAAQYPSMSQQFEQMKTGLLQSFHLRPRRAGRHDSGESFSSEADLGNQGEVNPRPFRELILLKGATLASGRQMASTPPPPTG